MLTRQICRRIHMGRIVPELDEVVANRYNSGDINLKKIPTRRNQGMVRLPARLQLSAELRLKRISNSQFRKEALELTNILYNRKLPDDSHTLKVKRADIKTELVVRRKVPDPEEIDHDRLTFYEESSLSDVRLKNLIEGTLQNRRRDWHYYEYNEYASDLYMATRLPHNYACVKTVLNEVRDLDPNFAPKSVLDFGSGMGTTIWAVNETWPDSVEEFMNVDISKDQQSLCEFLLRDGNEFGPSIDNVYHRQYLPTSTNVKYDMVMAAFSMLELPNSEMRIHTIENLWHKTNDLLILIERGNPGGFNCISEARHLVLESSRHDVTKKLSSSLTAHLALTRTIPESHIIAPCPHEFVCPRLTMSSKKDRNTCKFQVSFEPLEFGTKRGSTTHETFSYVILRKKPHPMFLDQDCKRWPRVVEKRLKSSEQITHKLCCPNGSLAESTFTQKKYGKEAYEAAKSCDWGDILPIKVKDIYISKSSLMDKKTSRQDKCDTGNQSENSQDETSTQT